MVGALPDKLPLKIWLDTGTREAGWERARELRDQLGRQGLAARSRPPIYRSGGRRSQRALLGGAFRGRVEVLVSAIGIRGEGFRRKAVPCRNVIVRR
jgi:hypothetical protein